MTSRPRLASRIALIVAALGLVAASVAVAQVAHAEPTVSWSSSRETVDYGTPWSAVATYANYPLCSSPLTGGDPWCQVKVDYTGTESGSFTAQMHPGSEGTGYVYLDPTLAGTASEYLGIGGYSFVLTYAPLWDSTPDIPGDSAPSYTVVSEPFQLTVTEATLTTSVTVSADPLTARNAVVSVLQSGSFVDGLGIYFDSGMPAGTWLIEITDGESEVFRHELVAPQGGTPYLVVPWTDVPGSTTFTATATLEVTGTDASRFQTSEGLASFTSATPAPTPTPSPTPLPSADAPGGLALPVWLLVLFGLIILGSATAIVILVLRRRRSSSPEQEGASDAE